MSEHASFAELKTFGPGAVLMLEGARTGALFVLKSGRLEVIREDTVVAEVDRPGAVLGEISALLDVPHSASVQAVTSSEVYVIADAVAALEARPAWMLMLARLLAQRVLSTTAALVASQKAEPAEIFVLPESAVLQLGDPQV